MAPGPQGGSAAQATQDLKLGMSLLQKAIGGLPMGSELHTSVLKALTDLSKHIDAGGADQAPPIQQLLALARQSQSAPPQAAAMGRMFPGAEPPPMQAGQ